MKSTNSHQYIISPLPVGADKGSSLGGSENAISGYMTVPAVKIFSSCRFRFQCLCKASEMSCIHHGVCWIISAVRACSPWRRLTETREGQKGVKRDLSQPAMFDHSPLNQLPPPTTLVVPSMAVTSDLPALRFRKSSSASNPWQGCWKLCLLGKAPSPWKSKTWWAVWESSRWCNGSVCDCCSTRIIGYVSGPEGSSDFPR